MSNFDKLEDEILPGKISWSYLIWFILIRIPQKQKLSAFWRTSSTYKTTRYEIRHILLYHSPNSVFTFLDTNLLPLILKSPKQIVCQMYDSNICIFRCVKNCAKMCRKTCVSFYWRHVLQTTTMIARAIYE